MSFHKSNYIHFSYDKKFIFDSLFYKGKQDKEKWVCTY